MMTTLNINGQDIRVDIYPDDMLVDVLRDIGLYGVKRGCDTTNCGLCTVWINEKPRLSCTYMAMRAINKRITTIEGVQEEAYVFGKLLAREGGEQCGFCSPGLIMSVLALKRNTPDYKNLTDEEINTYLMGNLCRCTGYKSQMRAIRRYLNDEQA